MENKFEDFETLMKKQISGYRMYPSGKVWLKINDHFHGKQRFAVGGVFVMLLISALLFVTEQNTVLQTNLSDRSIALNQNNTVNKNNITNQTFNSFKNNPDDVPSGTVVANVIDLADRRLFASLSNTDNSKNKIASKSIEKDKNTNTGSLTTASINDNNVANLNDENRKEPENLQEKVLKNTDLNTIQKDEEGIIKEKEEINKKEIKEQINDIQHLKTPELYNEEIKLNQTIPTNKFTQEAAPANIAVTNKKIRVQYYATPSISYRSLFDSRQKNNNINTGGINDLDKAVFHKPALGMEAGINWLLAMDNRLRLKTGFQFNYNRYNIKATSSNPEVTSIALFGRASDLTSVSTLRNNDGFYPKWIENSNLQISVPVGLEFTLANGKNVQLSLGSSVQPSLLLKNKMYMLSTDLKNYTQEPSLIRRFNINGTIESFITLNTKTARWHIGPQLRYQLLSTYTKAYPFKENLIDYGFKIGYSRPLK